MTINPKRVRYIKLGGGGQWEQECLENGIIRIGFGTASADRLALCESSKWDELRKTPIAVGDKTNSCWSVRGLRSSC